MATIQLTENQVVRTCQECGHKQLDTLVPEIGASQAYLMRKCKKCKSESLDYGNRAYQITDGKIERTTDLEDTE